MKGVNSNERDRDSGATGLTASPSSGKGIEAKLMAVDSKRYAGSKETADEGNNNAWEREMALETEKLELQMKTSTPRILRQW